MRLFTSLSSLDWSNDYKMWRSLFYRSLKRSVVRLIATPEPTPAKKMTDLVGFNPIRTETSKPAAMPFKVLTYKSWLKNSWKYYLL